MLITKLEPLGNMPIASGKETILPPVRPNVGITVWYRLQLEQLVDEMNASVQYWVKSSYRNNEPLILAQDELPAQALWRSMRQLRKRWQKNFDEAAPKLAKYFTTKVEKRSKATLAKLLRDAGMSVEFKMTRTQADGIRANIHENVSLIRSIPQKYFGQIEGLVMRSVQAGGDMYTLSQALQTEYGRTKKRARLIARDQNNKATAFLTRTRQTEMGIEEAIWLHSHGGKVPRPTHLRNNGKRYSVKKGWYDPDADGKGKGRYIHPGELINCRCVPRSVIPGFI